MQPRKQKFTESEARDDFNSPSELVEDKVEVKFGDTIEQKFAEQTSLSKPMTRNIFDLIPRPGMLSEFQLWMNIMSSRQS
jgi:hypothetical protein